MIGQGILIKLLNKSILRNYELVRNDSIYQLSEQERFNLAEKWASIIYPEYKFSEFNRTWLKDKEFADYYFKFVGKSNFHSYDRKFTLGQLIYLTDAVKGDIAECGVYQGASAYLMLEHSKMDKTLYGFDSFEGLPDIGKEDGNYWQKGNMSSPMEVAARNLKRFENIALFKGWIPEKFNEVNDKRFSFVHIDVDLYQPTKDSIEFFYPRLANGGIMLFDDYGFDNCPGVKKAVWEYLANNRCPESLINLTTGQALIQKIDINKWYEMNRDYKEWITTHQADEKRMFE